MNRSSRFTKTYLCQINSLNRYKKSHKEFNYTSYNKNTLGGATEAKCCKSSFLAANRFHFTFKRVYLCPLTSKPFVQQIQTKQSQIHQRDQLCCKMLQNLLQLMLQIVATIMCCSILESKIVFSILQNLYTLNLSQFSQYYVVCCKMQQKCCFLPQP